jgi:hypothetical protein
MSDSSGTLETIGRHLALAVRPLRFAVADVASFKHFMYRMGWNVQSLPPAYAALASLIDDVVNGLTALESSSGDERLSQALGLLEKVSALYKAIKTLSAAPDGVDAAAFLAEVPERLFELLLVDYLAAALHPVHDLLVTLGVIRSVAQTSGAGRPPYLRRQLDFDRLRDVIADPTSIPRFVYGWGEDDFDTLTLFGHLREVLEHTGALVSFGQASTSLVEGYMGSGAPRSSLNLTVLQTVVADQPVELTFMLLGLPAEDDRKPGLILQPVVPGALGVAWDITDALSLRIRPAADPSTLFGIVIRPDDISVRYPFAPGTGPPQFGFGVSLDYKPATATVLLGDASASRLSLQGAAVSVDLDSDSGGLELKAGLTLNGLTLVVAAADLDGFLGSLIRQDITLPIPLTLQWSNRGGISFAGAAGFTLSQSANLSLGPVTIQTLSLALRTTTEPAHPPDLIVEAGASIGGSIGPVGFAASNLGLRLSATVKDGNAGPFDIDIGFMPPDGIGLSVDADGVVTGGGFLFHDAARQIYAGVMQLSLHDQLTLTAFGLISTRMPDGSKGYSLLVFITAEDFQPIPLGLGFTLQGIGGMVAINRTFDETVLRAGMQNDTLRSLLFPRDPVTNAPAIINALATAFPAHAGSYLMGILVRIGWGTPTLIRLDLALVLEFGARRRLLALGRVSALLPSQDNDLVRLNLDAIGVLDLDQNSLAIDAELVDSRLLHKFALTGKGALRAGGSGAGSGFVLAIGGFNPRFAAPAGVPSLARVTIALSSGNNPRLTCESYFALTANTVQFGARAQLHAEAYGFSVDGDIGYDVLISRSPFHFIADFHASAQLKHGSHNLFKVSVEGSLEGPRPLRASGKASFEIFWCDFTVRFDKTLIDGDPPPLPPAVDVLGLLLQALSDPRSWRTDVPAGRTHGVALRKLAPGAALVIDPLGRLVVTQDVAPLNTGRDIDIFGGAPVAGARRFALGASLNGVTLTPPQALQAAFAPAQFFEMSDDEKLASPSFEQMDAGMAVGSDAVTFDPAQAVAAPLEYESIVIDTLAPPGNPPPPSPVNYALAVSQLQWQSLTGAASRAPVRRAGRARFRADGPAAVQFAEPRWAIEPIDGAAALAVDPSIRTWSEHLARLHTLNRGGARYQLVPAPEAS